jgi:gliding motility-associated lipoprotein GldH
MMFKFFFRLQFLALASVAIVLVSCSDKREFYNETQKFEGDLEWKKSDVKLFEIPIEQTNEKCEMLLSFRCATGFLYDKMLIRMIETAPDGRQVDRLIEIPVRNDKGEFYGDKGFDIVDIEFPLDLAKSFDMKGIWKFSFTQEMPFEESVDFPMELGVILRHPKNG